MGGCTIDNDNSANVRRWLAYDYCVPIFMYCSRFRYVHSFSVRDYCFLDEKDEEEKEEKVHRVKN